MYHGLNVKIEKMSELMHFAFVWLTISGTITFFLLMTLINYFIFDLGAESYYEDLLLMCVAIRKFESGILVEFFVLGCHSIGKLH